MKFNIDILPKWWSVVIWGIIALSLQGCYTQLAMFYPEPEIEQDEEQFYETYSRAVPRLNVSAYAQDGAGQSLGLAYLTMYNRFSGFMGFGSGYYNKYDYYNRYGYHAGYNGYDSYVLGGYTMYIPYSDVYASGERKTRTWTRDSKSSGTNLTVTRTRNTQSNTNSNTNSGGYNNSSNVSSNRGSSGGSSSSSSSSSSGGRRATRRN